MKIVYDADLIKYISFIENLSRVKVKDLFKHNEILCCVVDSRDVKNVVGPKGNRIRKMQDMLKKKIKVVGYSENVSEFVKAFVYPVEISDIEENEGGLVISCKDSKTKGLLIGRGGSNLEGLKRVVSRYFKISDIEIK
jgi:transcription termination/antitermination protein NusA